jgi:hypothetical protein
MSKQTGVIIQSFDIIDLIGEISKINKRYQATVLSKLELIFNDTDKFIQARKVILDAFNEYTREIIRYIFGDVEI